MDYHQEQSVTKTAETPGVISGLELFARSGTRDKMKRHDKTDGQGVCSGHVAFIIMETARDIVWCSLRV